MSSDRLHAARRQAADAKHQAVLDAVATLTRSGDAITASAVARTAGVARSYLYKHPDLIDAITTGAARQDRPHTKPAATRRLRVENAALRERLKEAQKKITTQRQQLRRHWGAAVEQPPTEATVARLHEVEARATALATTNRELNDALIESTEVAGRLSEELASARRLLREQMRSANAAD